MAEIKKTYYQERQEMYGITEAMNSVKLWRHVEGKNELVPEKIFVPSEDGIDIFPFSLKRNRILIDGERWKNRQWHITRYAVPKLDKKGKERKYNIPKGTGSFPFIPEQLVEKYERKERIKYLVLTEGYYKAFKAAMHGFDCIGLTSITHYKERETGALYSDIIEIIKTCAPEKIIWLVDGDCLNLTSAKLEENPDLYKRPNQFFSSANTMKRLLEDFDNIEKVFAHVVSDALPGHPKGLDDLLVELKGREQEALDDFNTWGKPGRFFHKIDMSYSMSHVRKYFNLHDVDAFMEDHVERGYKALKTQEFIFNGTRYRYNEEKAKCDTVVPGDARLYFRVGDQFNKWVMIPNKYGQRERSFHKRMKSTIVDDHGKDFVRHVPKYEAFCVVPNHDNYQPIIDNCLNLYFPFEHEAEEGDCPQILNFLKHIFGSGKIQWKNPKTGKVQEIAELELGLDYLQLLYKKPTQILPILCLVSKENDTGKSTMGKFLKMMFTQNVAIVGNAELSDNFNASWASRLLVICDEAKIDKQIVVEKVKSLSTADKIFMNAKGKDHVEIDFFGKFIFLTNNEENFIYASEEDVRYWIRKIPRITDADKNINLLTDMKDEIPAFLHLLDQRKMATENMNRAWFHPDMIKTEALSRVVQYSQPTIEKEIRQNIRDMFFDFPHLGEIRMTKKNIKEEFFRNKNYEMNYIQHVLEDRMKVFPYHTWLYKEGEYESWEVLRAAFPDVPELQLHHEAQRSSKVVRFKFPRWDLRPGEGSTPQRMAVEVNETGRPYVFRIEKFLTADEIRNRRNDPELELVMGSGGHTVAEGKTEDLPF